MANGLLVRVYNVGLGDCIYLQVPDINGDKHILIDCGTLAAKKEKRLETALADIREQLPDADDGAKKLDLLVVTHPHKDHIRGFYEDMWNKLFSDIHIQQLWLSTYMDPDHTQAEQASALRETASAALSDLREQSLSPELDALFAELSANESKKEKAIEVLRFLLPETKQIEPQYVDAERSRTGKLTVFKDKDISLQVLAPNHNIDYYYSGETEDGSDVHGLLGYGEYRSLIAGASTGQLDAPQTVDHPPKNIGKSDFRLLQSRLHRRAFSFMQWEKSLENDVSVVLLLEWCGRRLLFTGDAERHASNQGLFNEGHRNGSWNVMWHERDQNQAFEKPLDFLKVGHHGSENASPWSEKLGAAGNGDNEMDKLLDQLLPYPSGDAPPTAIAVVSATRFGNYKKAIPDRVLMEVLGERVKNPVAALSDDDKYPALHDSIRRGKPVLVPPEKLQPVRTDLAINSAGDPIRYVEVVFPPDLNAQPEVRVG